MTEGQRWRNGEKVNSEEKNEKDYLLDFCEGEEEEEEYYYNYLLL